MLASSTHNNKRGEDLRARLVVLSEIPDQWADRVRDWSALCRGIKSDLADGTFPTPSDEYLFFQTVLGAFPFNGNLDADWIERMLAYHFKAVREAKQHTSWMSGNKPYEDAIASYVLPRSRTQPSADRSLPLRAGSSRRASSTASRRWRSSSAHPASPTPTRAAKIGTSRWWIRAVAGPSITGRCRPA